MKIAALALCSDCAAFSGFTVSDFSLCLLSRADWRVRHGGFRGAGVGTRLSLSNGSEGSISHVSETWPIVSTNPLSIAADVWLSWACL